MKAKNILDEKKLRIILNKTVKIRGVSDKTIIGGMAYLTDVKKIPEEEFAKLADLDLLVIDALRREPHLSHICVDEALDYVARINPRRTYFTHMSHRIGLHESAGIGLPSSVKLRYTYFLSPSITKIISSSIKVAQADA